MYPRRPSLDGYAQNSHRQNANDLRPAPTSNGPALPETNGVFFLMRLPSRCAAFQMNDRALRLVDDFPILRDLETEIDVFKSVLIALVESPTCANTCRRMSMQAAVTHCSSRRHLETKVRLPELPDTYGGASGTHARRLPHVESCRLPYNSLLPTTATSEWALPLLPEH